jgi:hypothetical protein
MEVRKTSPVVMIAQTIRASLLASATATTLGGLRALSAASQSHNAPLRFGAYFNRPGLGVVDWRTYALCGDGA